MKTSQLSIACIRSLVIDTINQANSGHPGMALGSAPILYTLFTRHLKADPTHPKWINRDRFILSAGHASSLLYVMLHLCGYGIAIDDLKKFRQLDSITPGHPEVNLTPGVDASSGPLGQGIAQAVGFAVAEQSLKGIYEDSKQIFDHYTYVLCGDGCLQEGISQEAISFAGHQKLNKLILFYDANNVTLDGNLDLSFSENVRKRFEASEWNTIEIKDGNDIEAIDASIIKAKASDKPTLIMVHTTIGFGSKNQGTSKVHGSPLGEEDGLQAKKSYGFNFPKWYIPDEVKADFENTFIKRGKEAYKSWEKLYQDYCKNYPVNAKKIESSLDNSVATMLYQENPIIEVGFKEASRATSRNILNLLHANIHNLIGGSADVAGSVYTKINNGKYFTPSDRSGRSINFGIREFAMASVQNGILLHGGLRSYVGCFLVFADYLKPAIRMASLSHLPAIYLFSHDSIAVGEDGPTHQPIEQLAMLRSIPGVEVYRPCDANEVATSYRLMFAQNDHPCCIALTRQNLPVLPGTSSKDSEKGGYIVSKEVGDKPMLTIIASGSEVSLAVEAQKRLINDGIDVRVVSMMCQELFLKQDPTYIKETLGNDYAHRLAIEMLSSFGWHRFAPHVMGIDTFGASAPANDVIAKFKFSVDEVVARVKEII